MFESPTIPKDLTIVTLPYYIIAVRNIDVVGFFTISKNVRVNVLYWAFNTKSHFWLVDANEKNGKNSLRPINFMIKIVDWLIDTDWNLFQATTLNGHQGDQHTHAKSMEIELNQPYGFP